MVDSFPNVGMHKCLFSDQENCLSQTEIDEQSYSELGADTFQTEDKLAAISYCI